MSIISDIFGGGKTKVTDKPSTVPLTYNPPHDFRVNVGGKQRLTVLGNGQTINMGGTSKGVTRAFKHVSTSIGDQRDRIGGMISNLKSNQNPFIQARVRPLEDALAETLASTERGLTRRGVFGSLSTNELTKARFLGEQAIADERAKATDEALGALFDAETLTRGLNQDETSLAESMFREDLARVGLSVDALQVAMQGEKPNVQVAGGTTTTNPPLDILGSIGKIVGIGTGIGKLTA